MANEVTLNFTAEQIDVRLENAGNAILHTEQTLTPEQQEQARKNIGADVGVDKMLYLSDYGIDLTRLFMAGGGSQIIEDVGTFWEDVHATPLEQQLRLPLYFGSTLVMPQSVTRYCDETDGAMVSNVLQATMTFYFNGQFVTVSILMSSIEDRGAGIMLAIVSTTDIPTQQI